METNVTYLKNLILHYFTLNDINLLRELMKELQKDNPFFREYIVEMYTAIADIAFEILSGRDVEESKITKLYHYIIEQTGYNREYLVNVNERTATNGIRIYYALDKETGNNLIKDGLTYNTRMIIFMKKLVLDYLKCPINREFFEYMADAGEVDTKEYYYRKNGLLLVFITIIGNALSYYSDDSSESVTGIRPRFVIYSLVCFKR